MGKGKKGKLYIIFSAAIALFGVFVTTISTFTWFQIDKQDPQSSIISGSTNLSINTSDIYGYKIKHTIGDNGTINYNSDTVAKFQGETIAGTNEPQDGDDLDFDVPTEGIGYYLIKRKGTNGSYRYKYAGDNNQYSYKFAEYSSPLTNKAAATSVTFTANQDFRIKHYTFQNNETVNLQVKITNHYGGYTTLDSESGDVKVTTAGTYKVWFDITAKTVALELMDAIATANMPASKADNRNGSEETKTIHSNVLANPAEGQSNIDSGTTFRQIGFEQAIDNSGQADWFVHFWISLDAYRCEIPASTTWVIFSDSNNGNNKTSDLEIGNGNYYNGSSWSTYSGDTTGDVPNEGNKFIYYSNPNSWGGVNVHYWGGEGTVGSDWPGPSMSNVWHNTGYPGLKLLDNSSGAKSAVWYDFGIYHNYNNYQLTRWENNSDSSTLGSLVPDWSGNPNNTFENNSVTQNEYNYFKTYKDGNGDWQHTRERRSEISRYYVKDGVAEFHDYLYSWNSDTFNPANPSSDGYRFDGYFADEDCTVAFTSGYVSHDTTIYAKFSPLAPVTLKARLFIRNTSSDSYAPSNLYVTVGTDNAHYKGDTYTAPTEGYTSVSYSDDANGIYYTGIRNATDWWFDNLDCADGHRFTSGTLSETTGEGNVFYTKYYVTLSSFKTFYVDFSNSYYNGNRWSDVYAMATNGESRFVKGKEIAPYFYRLTMPSDYNFVLGNGSTGGINTYKTDYTGEFTGANALSAQTDRVSAVYVHNTDSALNHTYTWTNPTTTASFGTAVIQRYVNNDWETITDLTMQSGDGAGNNYFIFELGYQLTAGTKIRAVVSEASVNDLNKTYDYDDYQQNDAYSSNNKLPYYLKKDGTDIKIAENLGFTSARFNFYITNAYTLAIAMVPDKGNGYYIMNYTEAYTTGNYIGDIKMASNSETKAIYDGFYATTGKQIFIRSYINAVDTLYYTGGTGADESAKVLCSGVTMDVRAKVNNKDNPTRGVITFASPGYYSIEVNNGVISVSSYSVAANFKLNELDISAVDSAEKIWKQKTSIVLEVPFTCNNSYASSISLNVENGISSYAGVALYVSSEQITSSSSFHTDPYHFMRGTNSSDRSAYYNSLSSGSSITNQSSVNVSANSATTYYAYILIDYLPTAVDAGGTGYQGSVGSGYNTAAFASTNIGNQMWFYLIATQI